MLARLDPSGRLAELERAGSDEEVASLIASRDASAVAVDAPLEVPDATGRRDVERVLSWCDVAAFPVSARRLETVYGGARGPRIAPSIAREGRTLVEALPDQVLRQIAWEADHPLGTDALDLAAYRAAWLAVRAPRYRPKGVGRARTDGVLSAWGLLATVVDMDGWAPSSAPADDWAAIADAACIDAICCAYAALRLARGEAVCIGAPGRGRVALPADANLTARLQVTLERLRAEGAIVI